MIDSPSTRADVHRISLDYYTLDDLGDIVDRQPRLELAPAVEAKIDAGARFVVKKAAEGRYIYGVNTGFGSLCETRVQDEEMEALQYNHVVSHAVGIGEVVPERISRFVLLIKLLTFRSGHTGITVPTVKRFLDLWNHGLLPAIPKKGTVGASGDLAPLAHMGLPLLGLGKVHTRDGVVEAGPALEERGLKPLRLKPKEGLAVTNGVQYINAYAADCLLQLTQLIRCADVLAALSAQAFSASETFYQAAYHETSHHPERRAVASNLRRLLEGSNHHELPTCNQSKQDPYSFRCTPQVHGAIRQVFDFAQEITQRECNGVSDNPLFFPDRDEVLFGGNLHGQSAAFALDFLAIATSELASISERRTYQLLSGQRGLPGFLVERPGLNSGMMITQYTSAALVNENKVLATPASVDTIPTCQLQEDHVSMGGTSAYKLVTVVENCGWVFAIELLNAAQAVELNGGLRLSPVTRRIVDSFRETVPFLGSDRVLATDIERAHAFVMDNKAVWASTLDLE